MKEEPMDYREWLASFDEYEDHDKAALEALDDLGRLSQRARTVLLPILTEAFLMHRRQTTRASERQMPIGRVFGGESTIEQRQDRLAKSFALGDGRRVTWSEATVADHLARIEYLRSHIVGIELTIADHQAAIEAIRSHGVSCLGEIAEAA